LKDPKLGKLVRNFVIEMLVYAVLVVGYFLLVLRLLADPLARLFSDNLPLYAIVALLLIVAQGILLEALTSLIIGWLGLGHIE
jgi:hypothetical protein